MPLLQSQNRCSGWPGAQFSLRSGGSPQEAVEAYRSIQVVAQAGSALLVVRVTFEGRQRFRVQ
jgi:hypothetical protein